MNITSFLNQKNKPYIVTFKLHRGKGDEETAFKCFQHPHPDLLKLWDKLPQVALDILNGALNVDVKVSVFKAIFKTDKNGNPGVMFSCSLKTSGIRPWNFNTPICYTHSDETKAIMPKYLTPNQVQLLEALKQECKKYQEGKFAQQDAFQEDNPTGTFENKPKRKQKAS